ncbi:MAG TPA: ribonuclease H-like domain-containing protein [Blattabacteriaceae bacterium]
MLENKKIAVFDLEIKQPIESLAKGWSDHTNMGISCLCLFDYFTGRYRVFDDNSKLEALDILLTYDYIVGYNTVNFDMKVITACWSIPQDKIKVSKDFDILREIWISKGLNPDKFVGFTHGGVKLDDVAFETVKMRKTLDGATAPKLYQQNRHAEVIDYCLEDVRIEKTLFEFVVTNGFVIRNGVKIPIKFNI